MVKAKKALLDKNKQTPIIKVVKSQTHSVGGFKCCFCRCFTCVHIEFLHSRPGWMKLVEVFISGILQSLLFNYGLPYSEAIGPAFESALTTSTGCFINSTVLLICYILSEKSYKRIRSSLFETIFNTMSFILYACSASYLFVATNLYFWPRKMVLEITGIPYEAHYMMKMAYTLSGVASAVYGIDAYTSFKEWAKSRNEDAVV